MQRFVDRRTSVLMRRLKENAFMDADVSPTGEVIVEGQNIGRLAGFRFTPDPNAEGQEAKALRAAASKALAGEIEARATRLSTANDDQITLALDGIVRFIGEPIAVLQPAPRRWSPASCCSRMRNSRASIARWPKRASASGSRRFVQKHLGPLFALGKRRGGHGSGAWHRLPACGKSRRAGSPTPLSNDVRSLRSECARRVA